MFMITQDEAGVDVGDLRHILLDPPTSSCQQKIFKLAETNVTEGISGSLRLNE